MRRQLFLQVPPGKPGWQHFPLGQMQKQSLLKRDLSSMSGWSQGELSCLKLNLGLCMDQDQPSHPQHTPKQCFPPSLFLSVSKSLLGGCQEEPGFVLAEIFIREVVVLSRCLCKLQALEQAPKLPQNSSLSLEGLLYFGTGGAPGVRSHLS